MKDHLSVFKVNLLQECLSFLLHFYCLLSSLVQPLDGFFFNLCYLSLVHFLHAASLSFHLLHLFTSLLPDLFFFFLVILFLTLPTPPPPSSPPFFPSETEEDEEQQQGQNLHLDISLSCSSAGGDGWLVASTAAPPWVTVVITGRDGYSLATSSQWLVGSKAGGEGEKGERALKTEVRKTQLEQMEVKVSVPGWGKTQEVTSSERKTGSHGNKSWNLQGRDADVTNYWVSLIILLINLILLQDSVEPGCSENETGFIN